MAPDLVSPTDGAQLTGDSVILEWTASPEATTYFLGVSTSPSPYIAEDRVFWQEVGDTLHYDGYSFPADGTDFYWWVWAGNAYGWCADVDAIANGRYFTST